MTAVVLESYSGVEALQVEKRPVPRPGKNEVLVKMEASPINPSDLMFIQGLYGFTKPAPTVPGFEGSGTVVAAGSGLAARYLMGKRVACASPMTGDGTWAEYMVTTTNSALPLKDTVTLEQGAMSIVNPLTAVALIMIAKQGGHKTIVSSAAASALGQMLIRLARSEGINVINIVRREEQVALLKKLGATIVLNSSDPEFEKHLKETCRQHKARLAFDAVAGPLAAQILNAMPKKGRLTIYGGLSLQESSINPISFIFEGKSIDGFWLTPWLAQNSFLKNLRIWRRAQNLMDGDLRTEIRARYSLENAQKAVADYQASMTGGKVLITPGQG